MKGRFITFEGIEGCGKTTQIRLLDENLRSKGLATVLTREPGGTEIGDKIRGILLDPENKKMCSVAELLLYGAARAQHLEELVKPSIAEGKIVLCDRYSDSTTAYQGAARKLSPKFIKGLDSLATGGLKPDLTILLDIDPNEGLKRARSRRSLDRFEREEVSFHERVRKGYLQISREEPLRVKVVDGLRPTDEIRADITNIVEKLLR
ncbi:MAG: dTMP kinase [Deltaproteobacteria bacterium CG11_big_fil_rev_8_21_14_0_20_49_13]|nr:MAG: dTMP kinase [Deltaproteobacteria bacterium CG11_big_fil_rev_8_21_14_0_20_49_13]